MKKVFLVTVPAKNQSEQPKLFVTDDVSKLVGRFNLIMIQEVEFV